MQHKLRIRRIGRSRWSLQPAIYRNDLRLRGILEGGWPVDGAVKPSLNSCLTNLVVAILSVGVFQLRPQTSQIRPKAKSVFYALRFRHKNKT